MLHLEGVIKDKEELIGFMEVEKESDDKEKDQQIEELKVQLTSAHDSLVSREAELLADLAQKDRQ